ncbi:MAG: hypothetical protein Q8S27_01230 [Hoeflea sp.]|nr:hypothetical protein [Hoeflea sp.]
MSKAIAAFVIIFLSDKKEHSKNKNPKPVWLETVSCPPGWLAHRSRMI